MTISEYVVQLLPDALHLHKAIVYVLVALSIAAAISVLTCCIAPILKIIRYGFPVDRSEWLDPLKKSLSTTLALSVTGALIGLLGGLSRESVVGDVTPAIIAAVGGLGALASDKLARDLNISRSAFTSLILSFVILFLTSSGWRGEREELGFCRDVYANADLVEPAQFYNRDYFFGEYCGKIFKASGISE